MAHGGRENGGCNGVITSGFREDIEDDYAWTLSVPVSIHVIIISVSRAGPRGLIVVELGCSDGDPYLSCYATVSAL